MKTVSILIPIFNRLNITKEGLNSLYSSLNYYWEKSNKSISYKVIVIDDGSYDGSSEWISNNYSEIILLKGDGTLWWSGAINLGAEYAITKLKNDYVLLWNNDIFPTLDYFLVLEEIVHDKRFFNSIIGSKILVKGEENKIWSVGGFFNKYTGEYGMYDSINTLNNEIYCDWQPGMGTLIPVSIIVNNNLWWDSKNFPQYHGDSDFTLRCKKAGIAILTCKNLVIYNDISSTGLTSRKNVKELFFNLKSLKSGYNIYRNFLFYTKNGKIPTVYFGMLKKYYYYFGGYVKHNILKIKSSI